MARAMSFAGDFASRAEGSTLPGFMMPAGSVAALNAATRLSVSAPKMSSDSAVRYMPAA